MGKLSRLELHNKLKTVLGSNNVYFQPPESMKLSYPCIVYTRSNADTLYASNYPYKFDVAYQLTYISRDPDDPLIDEIAKLQMCRYDRSFKSEDLNHDVFKIYI